MIWQLVAPILLKLADLFFKNQETKEEWKKAIQASARKAESNATLAAQLRADHAKLLARVAALEKQQPEVNNGRHQADN